MEREDAPFLAIPNNLKPKVGNVTFKTDKTVPHPNNAAAEVTPAAEVMRQVMEGK